jgi:hypothetical protein
MIRDGRKKDRGHDRPWLLVTQNEQQTQKLGFITHL